MVSIARFYPTMAYEAIVLPGDNSTRAESHTGLAINVFEVPCR